MTGLEEEAKSISSKFNDPDQALVVEQELELLEAKIEQKHKLAQEEAAEDAKLKAEEEAGEFAEYLPTLPPEDEVVAKPKIKESKPEKEDEE